MNIPKFVMGILLVVPGAFMVSDSVLTVLGQGAIFFQVTDYKFEFIVGIALIMLGASNIDSKNKL